MSKIVNKDVEDCIQFYYLNKKKENLKKRRQRGQDTEISKLQKKSRQSRQETEISSRNNKGVERQYQSGMRTVASGRGRAGGRGRRRGIGRGRGRGGGGRYGSGGWREGMNEREQHIHFINVLTIKCF
jgi:hypothetical protein